MHLTITEAATLLGRSARTLRDQLTRGDVPGFKKGGQWVVPSETLPLTAAQRRALQARAEEIRGLVDEALPSRAETTRAPSGRSLADVAAFRAGWPVLLELRAAVLAGQTQWTPAAQEMEAALLALAEGVTHFHPETKAPALLAARAHVARAAAHLLLAAPPPIAEPAIGWLRALETEALPALAGLLRWTEGLTGRRGRD